MSTVPPPLFRFSQRERGLWLGSEAVAVPPKSLALLHALLERAGSLVTREELLQAAWPGVQVTADAVRYSMRQLRLALRDSATDPMFIETLPKSGWRFIGQAMRSADGSWRLAARGVDAPELRVGTRPSTPAGRGPETRMLREALGRARAGERQLVFVSGDAGIGKTTLLEAFLASIEADPEIVIARGQCVEDHGGGEAYLPIFETLERLCRAGSDASSAAKATDAMRRYAPSWLAQMPALTEPDEREMLRLQTQGSSQGRMIRELSTLLEALSVDQTLVLFIDDVQWSDVSTLEFLARCLRRPEPARLLVVIAHRPMDGRPASGAFDALRRDLSTTDRVCHLVVPFLESAEVREHLASALGEASDPADLDALGAFVTERTEGHPLFMVSLVEELSRRSILERKAGTWRLAAALDPGLVPRSLEQLLAAGLDGIEARERELLEMASVIGMRASAAAIAAVAGAEPEEVETICESLARRGRYLVEREPERRPDGSVSACFEFRHGLHRELFASTVTEARRARWHRAVGEDKERAFEGHTEAVAAELAQHFAEAGDAERASAYFALSGEASARVSANGEAIDQLRKALEWTARLPDGEAKTFRELGVRLSLSAPLASTHGYATAELAENLARIEALAEGAVESPAFQPVLLGLWSLYLVRGDLAMATEIGERLVRLAQQEQDPLSTLQAHRTLGFCRLFEGHLEDADAELATGRAAYPFERHARLDYSVGDDPVVLVLCYEAWVAWFRGDPDRAADRANEAVAWARRLEHPPSLAFALGIAGVTHHLRQDDTAARETAEELLELAGADGMAMWHALGQIVHGWAQSRSESADVAGLGIDEMRTGLANWEATGSELGRPYFLCMVAEALARHGMLPEASALIPVAEEAVERSGQVLFVAEVARIGGVIAAANGHEGEAADAFRSAIANAEETGAGGLGLRASLGLFDQAEADAPDAASTAIAAALGRCTPAEHDADQRRARQLLPE